MELKYPAALVAGIIIALVIFCMAFFHKEKPSKEGNVKLANTNLHFTDRYYKRQVIMYYVLRVILVLSLCAMIVSTAGLISRPYFIKKIKENRYNRDIILCLDISSSVDELNMKLVSDLKDIVSELSGERIGIVIFNTTPVVLSPLTDDYEYTLEQLENIRTAIKKVSGVFSFNDDDWLYMYEYLYGGTLVGNELRGSSLIGDGLLGGLFALPTEDKDRTKIIIFSSDNDENGDSFVTLKEAADYCRKNNTTVYGIGTKNMFDEDRKEMEEAINSTGGQFFLEENASSFHTIVEKIEEKSENLTPGKTIIKMVETPEPFFCMLAVSFVLFVVSSLLLRRENVALVISYVISTVLLMLVYLYAVRPAHDFSKGPDLTVKKKANLDVLFVIDNTISMVANDIKYNKARNIKAAEDACMIIDELEGASFSVISFNNDAMLLSPLSCDVDHVKNAINSMYPIEKFYAAGSSLDTPKALMSNMLKSAKADGKKTAVFYLSDGEITAEGASLSSFADLKQYIDGGAVLGYGTKEGGTMTLKRYWADEDEQVMDYSVWPTEPAVSKIDEKNLKSIAKDMGIIYKNMSQMTVSDAALSDGGSINGNVAGGKVSGIKDAELSLEIMRLKAEAKTKEEVTEVDNSEEVVDPPKYYGFLYLIPIAMITLFYAVDVVRKK